VEKRGCVAVTESREILAMVAQYLENNGTDPLTYRYRWMHEGADLR
jgi:hypothetical protein